MQILSALDAVSPAFARTRLVLFTPFRKGRTWKLATTGYLSSAGTIFFPIMLLYLAFVPTVRRSVGPWAGWALIAGTLLLTGLYTYIFYLCSRLRFAFFDTVLNRGAFVAPAWRKYGSCSFKWTLFKMTLGTLLMAAIAAPSVAYVRHMITLFSSLQFKPGEPPPPELMASVFSFYASFALVYLLLAVFFFGSSLLSDFIVPSLALEDTSLVVAFQRLGKLLRNEPGQMTAYAVLKLGLGFAFYFGAIFIFELVFFVVILVVGLLAFAIGYLLHTVGVPLIALYILGGLLGTAVYLFLVFYGLFLVVGTIMTFLESYSLYFLGGRYPMLGDMLVASTPPPVVRLPPPGYPAYGPVPQYGPGPTPPQA